MHRKLTTWLLLLSLLVTLFPADFASVASAAKREKHELVDQRTATTKLIDNADGTFTKQVFFKPRHHKKGNAWQETSTKLVAQEERHAIASENTELQTEFAPKMKNGQYVTLQDGAHSLTYSFTEASGPREKAKPADVAPTYEDNRITYDQVVNGLQLRNIVSESSVKEDVILTKFTGFNKFQFRIDTDLTAKKESDGSITFSDDQEVTIFSLPKPFMTDSNIDPLSGEAQRSDDVSYDLKKQGHSWLLTLTADTKWLQDPSRKYPIYIDPTTKLTNTWDTFISSAYPSQNYQSTWDANLGCYVLKVGTYDNTTGTNYAFEKIPLPADLKDFQIDSATFRIYTAHSYYSTTPTGVWLDTATSTWSPDKLTWSNQPSSKNNTSTQTYKGQWASFDVTDAIKNWALNPSSNFGFKLHTNGNGQTYWKKFFSADNTTNYPYLEITYRTSTPTAVTGNPYANATDSNSGYVDLRWQPVPNAEGYRVWVFNGSQYESFDVGNVTSWSTQNKGIWPTPTEIASGGYKLHHDGTGAELSRDPSTVYRNSGGSSQWGSYPNATNYFIRVSAYSKSFGEGDMSVAIKPSLPDRAQDVGVEDFWSFASIPKGQVNSATGNFVLSRADISIDGLGPDVSLTRTYNSRSRTDGPFGLGWSFNMGVRLQEDATGNVLFQDADATTHLFSKNTDGTYTHPPGVYLDLTKNTSGFTLINKAKTKHFFDLTGRLLKIQDANNNSLTLFYNASNQLSTLTDATGRNTELTYFPNGKIATVKTPAGRIWSYTYEDGFLKTATDPTGQTEQYNYTDGVLTSLQDPTHTDSKPVVTVFGYTTGRLTSVQDQLKHTWSLVYDESARKLTVNSQDGKSIEYYTNIANNPSKTVVDPSSKNPLISTYQYDHNNLTQYKDPNTNAANSASPTRAYTYDDRGNVTKSQDPLGTREYQYNANNDLINYTDASGHKYANTYDGKNLITSTAPSKVSVANLYDSRGNGNITASAKSFGMAENLVSNSGVEQNASGIPAGYKVIQSADSGSISLDSTQKKTGASSLKVTTNTTTSTWGCIAATQQIAVQPNTTYTLSGWIKTDRLIGANAFFNVEQLKSDGTDATNPWVDNRYSPVSGTEDWNERQLTFTTGPDVAKVLLHLEVDHSTPVNGSAWFDNIQLKPEAVLTRYNFLTNSSFEKGLTDWQNTNGAGTLDTAESFDGNQSLKMSRAAITDSAIQYRQQIILNQATPEPLTLTGMSKSQGVTNAVANTPNADYSIWANVYYADGTLARFQAKFPLGTHDWQRAAETIIPTQPIQSVDLYAIFRGNNLGTVWFDNLRLQTGRALTKFDYDTRGNYVETTTSPLGYSSHSTYDVVGNLLTITDALQNTHSFTYDALDRLWTASYPSYDTKIIYTRDANGNVTERRATTKDESKTYHTVSYLYDEANQLITYTDALKHQTRYEYDVTGNLSKAQYPDGSTNGFLYDGANRVTDVLYNGTMRYHFAYDNNGNPTQIDDARLSQSEKSGYDKANRLISRSTASGAINWSYDANNNLKDKKITNSTNTITNSYTYNNVNQNTALTDNAGRAYRFAYDEIGNLRTAVNGNGAYSSYVYDDNDQLTTLKIRNKNGSPLADYQYTSDENGNRKTVKDSTGTQTTYTYDELNQLRTETDPITGNTTEYIYDPLGNLTAKSIKDKMGQAITTSYAYNAMNQLTAINGVARAYDLNGNLIDDGTKQYLWDAESRLIEVRDKSTGNTIATYEYDSDDRRIRSTVNGITTNYVYDGDSINVLYETNAANQLTRSYTYSASGALLSMTEAGGDTYFYHTNVHGDIIAVTDSKNTVVARYTYDAWGNILKQEGSFAAQNPYRYAGYRYDSETGLYYLIKRYYDPVTYRFLSLDPEASLNDYVYAGNNPVTQVDPDGKQQMPDGVGGSGGTTTQTSYSTTLPVGGGGGFGRTRSNAATGATTTAASTVAAETESVVVVQSTRWRPGDSIYTPTYGSREPSWSTVRRRFWMNESLRPDSETTYGSKNVERMKQGLPPERYSRDKGGMEKMELSHEPIPKRQGGKDITPRWPQEHAEIDHYRRPGY